MLSLVSVSDAFMLGLLDGLSMSAVSLAGNIQFILSLFITGIAVGLGIMMAQYYGKGDKEALEKIIPISLRINIIFSLLFTLAAFRFPSLLMTIFTNENELILIGSQYLKAVAPSYLLCGLSQIYLIAMKNTGYQKISSLFSSIAVVINIILDAIFIFGLGIAEPMGVVGAAYATVIARFVELVLCIIETSMPEVIHVRWSLLFKKAGELEKDFWHYTAPVLFASLIWGLAFSMYSVIIGHMGTDAVSAYSIVSIVKTVFTCACRGLGSGVGIHIGGLLGKSQFDQAKSDGKKMVILSLVFGLITCALMIATIPLLDKVLNITPISKYYLKWMLVIYAINVAGQSVNITVLDGLFGAGGDTMFDAIGNIFAMWLFSVPLGFITGLFLKWPVIIVMLIVSLDEFVKMPAVFARYRKYIWLRNITRSSY